MQAYPFIFEPIYRTRIWGGQNLARLFGRDLPYGEPIGESWELADLDEGTSLLANGPEAGATLAWLTHQLGVELLGTAPTAANGRFPLLLKLLDASQILSLQVHPDAATASAIGGGATAKTECWYVLESRDGSIYKGLKPGVTAEQFRRAIREDRASELVRHLEVRAGDFHHLPAGMVHAIGAGLVVAEVQTASDTTYRVSDWGRGREVHVEQAMRSIHFGPTDEAAPGAEGERLLATAAFDVALRRLGPGHSLSSPRGVCQAVMMIDGEAAAVHNGPTEQVVELRPGRTVLLPAALDGSAIRTNVGGRYLEITIPGSGQEG